MRPSGKQTTRILAGALLVLVPAMLFVNTVKKPLNRLEKVRERGSLVMLTRNGASSYFLGADGETGPEYERARLFAEFLGVDLEVRVASAFNQLAGMLQSGEGDLIAANLTRTPQREKLFRFGPDYDETRIEVVYRRGTDRPSDITGLVGKNIAVIAGSSYEDYLRDAQQGLPGINWLAMEDAGIEDILQAIDNGEVDVTLVDANIYAINKHFYPRVMSAFELDASQPQAWAFKRDNDDSLVQEAEVFMRIAQDKGYLARISNRFFGDQHRLDQVGMFHFLKQVRERLPAFMPIFQEVAGLHDMDWRLLAAMGYQESHWDPLAASPTGVRGLMMLTQSTATQMGLDDRTDPGQSIDGGARYLIRLWNRIPDRIPEPDRTWMALAAYNMGWGHLEDTRVLTQSQGGDPDSWADVSMRLPLLTQEKHYRNLRYGYARGHEAQRYVRNVRNYFEILVWMDTRDHPLLVANNVLAP